MSCSRKAGFNLIELIVVLTLLAILLAIVAKPIVKAKRYALLTVCKTNLRSIYGGNQAFLVDNDWLKPQIKIEQVSSNNFINYFATTTMRQDGEPIGQGKVLAEHLGNQIDLYLCPAVTVAGDLERDRANWEDGISDAGCSYIYEWNHLPLRGSVIESLEAAYASIRFNTEPGTTALLKDFNVIDVPGLNEPFLAHPYLRRCNVLYNDGAVKTYSHDDGTVAARWVAQDVLDVFEILHNLR